MTIKQKQWQLYCLGYYGGKIDGIWGAQSKAATVRFQKDHELDADGIFGPVTTAKTIEVTYSSVSCKIKEMCHILSGNIYCNTQLFREGAL